MVSKYLRFELIRDTGKTQVYQVLSVSQGTFLGHLRWHGAWRQYVFEPEFDTIWNKECLRDLAAYLDGLMAARRKDLFKRQASSGPTGSEGGQK